jgi:hypothetical protein
MHTVQCVLPARMSVCVWLRHAYGSSGWAFAPQKASRRLPRSAISTYWQMVSTRPRLDIDSSVSSSLAWHKRSNRDAIIHINKRNDHGWGTQLRSCYHPRQYQDQLIRPLGHPGRHGVSRFDRLILYRLQTRAVKSSISIVFDQGMELRRRANNSPGGQS